MSKSLPVAVGIRMHAKKKMNCGGPVKMAEGGEVEQPESQQMATFSHKDLAQAVMDKLNSVGIEDHDDFLTSDEDTPMETVGMPDDTDERMEAMEPKGILHGIMQKIHKKHKGV